jgi:serine/threonine-protein kinase
MSNRAQSSALDVGATIADTYRLSKLIGKGGMGTVYAADHERLPGRQVAIKVLNTDVADDPESAARFKREAEVVSRLRHPNIVEIEDYNTLPSGHPYLVLELLEGETLDDRLRRGPLSLTETKRVIRQIGSALRKAHEKEIIHRDLKPHNIFIARTEHDGRPTEQIKVLDFGISKIRGSETIKTQTSTVMGTPQYMSPEQATGQHEKIDRRTDIFCLGMLAYEMLSGQPPFDGQNIPEVVFKIVYEAETPLTELVPDLPANVYDAVAKAMAKEQDDRFDTVRHFVESLTGDVTQPEVMRPLFATGQERAESSMAMAATVGTGGGGGGGGEKIEPVNVATLRNAPAKNRTWLVAALAVPVMAALTFAGFKLLSSPDEKPRKAQTKVVKTRAAKSTTGPTAGETQETTTTTPAIAPAADAGPIAPPLATDMAGGDSSGTAIRDKVPLDAISTNDKSSAKSSQNHNSKSTVTASDKSVDDAKSTESANGKSVDDAKEDDQSKLPEAARTLLASGERALRNRSYDDVMKAARKIQGLKFRGAGQFARYLQARALCLRRQHNALAVYRQISKPSLKSKVRGFCAKVGFPVDN